MKNNNKTIASSTLEIINNIFEQNGKNDIPDIKQVCFKAKINRSLALKYLYEWWEKYQKKEKKDLLNFHSVIQNLKGNNLENAIIHLQCLAKELNVYNSSLNHLPNSPFPLGNFLLNSLEEIESKLFITYSYLNELNQEKKMVEEQLIHALHENRCLHEKIQETERSVTVKLEHVKEQLDDKKREVVAANRLVKSLKRTKRRPTLKDFFYDYNLMMK